MTAVPARVPARHVLWERLGRSLLPSYGARANAADGLLDLRQTRLDRAEAAEALARSDPSSRNGDAITARSSR